MHDMLEGVCPLEVKLILNELIRKGCFTLETLNARITSYNYGLPDKRNKPCNFSQHALRNPDGSAKQNAGQMWCLIRHLGLMIGDLVPEDDEHWDLILVLLSCMDIIFAPVLSKGNITFVQELIKDHHLLFLQLFPDRQLKPKHHFMTHYHSAMRILGPLINLWVMRFEALHNFSKRLSHIVCNFQNIAKTLAYRNSMLLCHNIMAKRTLSEDGAIEIGPGESVVLASLEFAELMAHAIHIPIYDDVYIAKWCKVSGTEYSKHMMVVVKKTDDGYPVFAKIRHVVVISNSTVHLVSELWHTVGFKQHFHAYIVQPEEPASLVVSSVDQLIDFHPLHVNKSFKAGDPNYYVNLRHIVG
jgi:hypothetical protein